MEIQKKIDKSAEESTMSEKDLANFVPEEQLVKARDDVYSYWMSVPEDQKLNMYSLILAVNTYIPPW